MASYSAGQRGAGRGSGTGRVTKDEVQASQRQLIQCGQLNQGIGQWLERIRATNSSFAEELEDFYVTNDRVARVLQALSPARTSADAMPEALVENGSLYRLSVCLRAFLSATEKLSSKGKIKRFLQHNRLRKKLERANAEVHNELKVITADVDIDGRGSDLTRSGSRIHDQEGLQMWETCFGVSNTMVDWNSFMKGFSQYLNQTISISQERLLKHILDNSNTGFVSAFRFSEFLKGFGPVKNCIKIMTQILSEKWCYGFLSAEEAIRYLDGAPVGTFLVRFSKSRPGSFALAFVYKNYKVIPVLVESCMPIGLKIQEENGTYRLFRDLYAILEHYKNILKYPFEAPFSRESWFHGDITREEAEELLTNEKPGTFLIRFSEHRRGAFCCTFVRLSGDIYNIHIDKAQHGFATELDPTSRDLSEDVNRMLVSEGMDVLGQSYATLHEYVHLNRQCLRYNYNHEGVPSLRVARMKDEVILETMLGPADSTVGSAAVSKNSNVYARSVTTYPSAPGGWQPICDRYGVCQYTDRTLLVLADGCNWGSRPLEAAVRASEGFLDYMHEPQNSVLDVQEVGHYLLRSFSVAHNKIIEGHSDVWDAGTTTLIGGIILQLDEGNRDIDPKWGFVCASIGDCKAYLWSPRTQTALDITAKNRGGLDAKDPGGRLGPYVEGGGPDLRNLRQFFVICEEGDIIFCCSDGVHDNLDPLSLGKLPCDLGYKERSWDDIDIDLGETLKQKYTQDLLQTLLRGVTDPKEIAMILTEHALAVTNSSRDFMVNFPNKRLPNDYTEYPGKMDHTTCVAVRVGRNFSKGS